MKTNPSLVCPGVFTVLAMPIMVTYFLTQLQTLAGPVDFLPVGTIQFIP